MKTIKAEIVILILSVVAIVASTRKLPIRKNEVSPGNIISCGPAGTKDIYQGPGGKFIALLPGWGSYSYPVSTMADSAQSYFNQGLTMYYSYHGREAVASFKEAIRFDSTCAMAYWGQALAMGPTYNYGYAYKLNKELPKVISSMNLSTGEANGKEKDLIEAMNRRYDLNDTSDSRRKQLNENYATAMKLLVEKYPDDVDIKALYTDAVMLIHPWDFWHNDGTPKTWTQELVSNCEAILKTTPHHPAALHYYIHTTEASRNPTIALASADSLKKLFPGIAHMVHMSSHEYERIGYYASGVDANEKADAALVAYDSLAKQLSLSLHVPHYYAVDAYCALSGAMYQQAIPKAITCRNSVSPDQYSTYDQYLYMFPAFTMVRMGKWTEILNDTSSIPDSWTYAALINDFAKGMAYAKTGKFQQATGMLKSLRLKLKEDILKQKGVPFKSSSYECALVAENILQGVIFFGQKKNDKAIAAINDAISAEDKLLYSEPKMWMLPARQYLGAWLLQLNKPGQAEVVYREDLIWNPGNGWSLVGLYKSLVMQNRKQEAARYKELYLHSFSRADVIPDVSAY